MHCTRVFFVALLLAITCNLLVSGQAQAQIIRNSGSFQLEGPGSVNEGETVQFSFRHNITFQFRGEDWELFCRRIIAQVSIRAGTGSSADAADFGFAIVGANETTITRLPASFSLASQTPTALGRNFNRRNFSITIPEDDVLELAETFTIRIDSFAYDPTEMISQTFDGETYTFPCRQLGFSGRLSGRNYSTTAYPYNPSTLHITIRRDRPPAPSGLRATSNLPGEATVSWDLPTGATATMLVARYQSGFGPAGGDPAQIAYSGIAGSSSRTTSHTFTGLGGNVAYDFYIRAVNSDGRTGAAATASAMVLATPIGFENTSLTVTEGADAQARVCVAISDPTALVRAPFSLSLRTMDGTATAGDDYEAVAVALGPFTATNRRECTDVGIINDGVFERTRDVSGRPGDVGNFQRGGRRAVVADDCDTKRRHRLQRRRAADRRAHARTSARDALGSGR